MLYGTFKDKKNRKDTLNIGFIFASLDILDIELIKMFDLELFVLAVTENMQILKLLQ